MPQFKLSTHFLADACNLQHACNGREVVHRHTHADIRRGRAPSRGQAGTSRVADDARPFGRLLHRVGGQRALGRRRRRRWLGVPRVDGRRALHGLKRDAPPLLGRGRLAVVAHLAVWPRQKQRAGAARVVAVGVLGLS
eukprot:6484901-Prymnesium_polylepis.1